MTNREPQTLTNPILIDNALLIISEKLKERITWLDTIYGKCEHHTDNDKHKKPIIYSKGREYIDLFPDEHKENFSFYDVEDGTNITHSQLRTTISAKVNLIIYGNFEKVYGRENEQNFSIENIKAEIDNALKNINRSLLRLSPSKFYERPENVYKGFSTGKVTTARTMRPFFCLRYCFDLNYTESKPC